MRYRKRRKGEILMALTSTFPATLKQFGRGLEGFRKQTDPEFKTSGIKELDGMLGGGFPSGSVVELCGMACSGRTSLSLALLAQATRRQEACALIDVSDCFDPASAAAAGVDLDRLLWIRCGESRNDAQAFPSAPQESSRKEKNSASAGNPWIKKAGGGHGWRHPREQIRGVETAIPSLLSAKNAEAENKLSSLAARCAGEQVEADRQLPRRGDNVRRRVVAMRKAGSHPPDILRDASRAKPWNTKPWKRLEQAIKATDLLLHAGGWGIVVFDMGNISWTESRRIELSTWFRFRRAVENTPAILLLVGEESCAKSCASLVLHCRRRGENWDCAAVSEAMHEVRTLQGFAVEGEVLRSRTGLQPGDSARWAAHTVSAASF